MNSRFTPYYNAAMTDGIVAYWPHGWVIPLPPIPREHALNTCTYVHGAPTTGLPRNTLVIVTYGALTPAERARYVPDGLPDGAADVAWLSCDHDDECHLLMFREPVVAGTDTYTLLPQTNLLIATHPRGTTIIDYTAGTRTDAPSSAVAMFDYVYALGDLLVDRTLAKSYRMRFPPQAYPARPLCNRILHADHIIKYDVPLGNVPVRTVRLLGYNIVVVDAMYVRVIYPHTNVRPGDGTIAYDVPIADATAMYMRYCSVLTIVPSPTRIVDTCDYTRADRHSDPCTVERVDVLGENVVVTIDSTSRAQYTNVHTHDAVDIGPAPAPHLRPMRYIAKVPGIVLYNDTHLYAAGTEQALYISNDPAIWQRTRWPDGADPSTAFAHDGHDGPCVSVLSHDAKTVFIIPICVRNHIDRLCIVSRPAHKSIAGSSGIIGYTRMTVKRGSALTFVHVCTTRELYLMNLTASARVAAVSADS